MLPPGKRTEIKNKKSFCDLVTELPVLLWYSTVTTEKQLPGITRTIKRRTSIMSLIHVTSENFEKALQAAPGVAVVDFFATWCGPCKMLAPVIEEAAEDMPEIQFYKVDVDEAPELARSFKVMSVPTLAFFKNGELVKKNVGAISYEELEELINSVK
ncbi:thioredoxin [Fusicatenibacter sp.]